MEDSKLLGMIAYAQAHPDGMNAVKWDKLLAAIEEFWQKNTVCRMLAIDKLTEWGEKTGCRGVAPNAAGWSPRGLWCSAIHKPEGIVQVLLPDFETALEVLAWEGVVKKTVLELEKWEEGPIKYKLAK